MRRIVASAILIALVQLAVDAAAQSARPAAKPAAASDIRINLPLATGWRFHLGDVPGNPEEPSFADAAWTSVTVPHTWNRVGYYKPNPESHINTAANVNNTQGIGWYRLSFKAPAKLSGKCAWLQFDAASRIASVWLNGVKLGEHKGGFSRFRLDATAAVKPGEQNVLAVKVDNTKPALGASTADVLPLAGDFFVHGGLYRPVSLIATQPLHFDMLDFGGPGIYASTTALSPGRASLAVRERLRNDGASAVRATLRLRLVGAAGHVAAEKSVPISVEPNAGDELSQTLDVAGPHLWQGVADPFLYRLVVDLVSPSGAVLDRVNQPFGIRQVRFDPAEGFFLNGKHLVLHGVGYHQDREGKGWALDPGDTAADVQIMREMGVNAIRLTHYQHGQNIHELADRYGLILWDEIPFVTVWTLGTASEATPGLRENARQQLRELIHQDFNHPSVVTWSIANEVDFGNTIPAFLTTQKGAAAPDPLPLLRELNLLAKAEDASRPTTLATCCEGRASGPGTSVPITSSVTDLAGANRYFGWYYDQPGDLGPHLDSLHSAHPQQPLAVTEYGAGGATTLHTDDALGGPESRDRPQAEEYESYIHEQNWATLQSKPFLWATFLWNSFDFGSTARTEGDAQDINTKGIVTYDRKIRKDAYFFYKANWTDTPTVHINGSRYVDRAYPFTTVHVYSNAPATDLLVNGKSAGRRKSCPERVCVWDRVPLSPGENSIVARGLFAGKAITDSLHWHLDPDHAKHIRIDSGALVAASTTFGSDAFFNGGKAEAMTTRGSFGKPAVPLTIAGAKDNAIAATYREGDFSYAIPLANGRYSVTLTFVEPSAPAGKRRFTVSANGTPMLQDLDIAAAAGGPLIAITRQFSVDVTQGELKLQFTPTLGQAIVSAVEISR